MSAWDYSEGHDCIRLLCQYLDELLIKPKTEQYVIKNVEKSNIPSTLEKELAKGSKYINHFKTGEKVQYCQFEREETYCIIFEREKADN